MKLDVLKTTEPLWYADGLSFTCTQCGNCCTGGPGFVWISEVEIERLAEHLGLSVQQTLQKYCRRIGGRISLKEKLNRGSHDCIFLAEIEATRFDPRAGREVRYSKRICQIYDVRPLQCRTWPFWPENLRDEKAWAAASKKCPGMGRTGRHFTLPQIESIRDAEDWPKRPPSSQP
jgi:uncharacterized protein